jgi:alkanesulfonate monooxygenase SsuD/methylene tetrahydromethanopterin reductase-like flavin-dependent oxidoreductase (luciferase family)
VAKAAVTLDHLSGGRLILGVGLGDVMTNDKSFTPFGDARPLRQRGAMLDEGLAVLEGLWSGEPFSFDGSFYRIDSVRLCPCPVQQPRIPIWVGGGYPLEGPVRRALRWDGSCLYIHKRPGEWEDWTPEDVAALRSRARRERGDVPFDIVVGGRARGADEEAERKLIRSLGEAGATWWGEYLPPSAGSFEEVLGRVSRGPLR